MPDSRFQPVYFHYENVRNGRLPGTRYLLLPAGKVRQKISEFTQKSLDGDFANRQQSFGMLNVLNTSGCAPVLGLRVVTDLSKAFGKIFAWREK
jgi:hypothetical protein